MRYKINCNNADNLRAVTQHLSNAFRYYTVKPVLSGHSKENPIQISIQTCVFKIDYHLMPVQSIAECSVGAFCNTFDLH